MEKQRNIKILSIIALVLAIAGMSLGFAAFSATLNISSSASVTPSSSDFKVVFSKAKNGVVNDENDTIYGQPHITSNGVTATVGHVGYTTISDLEVNFTSPGQYVEIDVFAHNKGKYDAYLRAINITNFDNGSYKKCSTTTATDALVQSACEGLKISLDIEGTTYDVGTTNISGHKLLMDNSEEVTIRIEYLGDSALADGPFTVEFGGISLDYSTVDGTSNLINFKIDGVTYQAEEGMTWEEWVVSDYNTIGAYIENGDAIWYDNWDIGLGGRLVGAESHEYVHTAGCLCPPELSQVIDPNWDGYWWNNTNILSN